MKLSRFYDGVRERIEQSSYEDKRLAFEALALKVRATPQNVEITAVIPVDITTTQSSDSLLTTEQTSGLQLIQTYVCDLATGHTQMSTSVVPNRTSHQTSRDMRYDS